VAALTHPSVSAIVVVRGDDPSYAEEVHGLAGRLRGLVDIRILVIEDTACTRARALNAGLDAAGGEFVCFLDDGDVLYPQFADVLIGELTARPELTAAYGMCVQSSGRTTPHGFLAEQKAAGPTEPFDRVRTLLDNSLHGGALLYRRADLCASGIRFDETLEVLEDWALLRGLCRWHELSAVAEPVAEHRRTDTEPLSPEAEARRERTRAAIFRSTADLPLAITEDELRSLISGSQETRDRLRAEAGRAAALSDELAEARRRLDALRASPVPRLYRALRRTGLHRPLRAAYRLTRPRRTGR
jgi:hypothetical protein